MNNSQLLYKILNLQHSIHRKQVEYNHALKTNNQSHINARKEALVALQTELDGLMAAFNAIPAPEPVPVKPQKTSWWLRFFRVKAATDSKY